ncbi:MAG TPA: vWA domain-containing protein, partial [Dehalococcoidia bacterium]|nr:vWA domain-containing protein [Dehalococcoidia bacterium]
MLRRLLLALSALVIGGAAVPTVHSQEAATVRISSVDASEYPHITANLDVLDATQRPVLGLDQGAFAAALGSSPVAVTSVAGASDQGLGLAVVLTFDVSGSMQGAPLAAAKDAGNALISQLGPNDQVAIMAFSDGVRAVQPFTQDRAVLTTAIDGLASSGNTALYSAVVASAQMAGSSGLPRRAVVLLSDGIDFGGGSQTDAAGSAGAAQASGVPFFVVGLGGQIDQAYLDQLASASRGQLLLAPDPQVLGALYTNIGDILRHQYALRIDASGIEAVPGAELTVTVAAAGTSTSATATLQFPAGILPTATVQATPPAVATPAPRTNQEPAGGGGISLVLVLIVAAAGLGGGVPAFVFLRRRAKTNAVEGELVLPRREDQRPVYAPIEPAVPASPAGAHLELL